MPALPAICETCGIVFASPYIIINSSGGSIKGAKCDCPRCGGMAHVQDGIYDAIGNRLFLRQAFDAINESNLSKDDLHKLEQVLRSSQSHEETTERVAASVESSIPSAASLARLIISQDAANLAQILSLLIALIMWLQSNSATTTQSPDTVIEQIVISDSQQVLIGSDNILSVSNGKVQAVHKDEPQLQKPHISDKIEQALRKQKIGRNDPCSCESGRKWKHCHGRKQ